jgi:hypothetical protein
MAEKCLVIQLFPADVPLLRNSFSPIQHNRVGALLGRKLGAVIVGAFFFIAGIVGMITACWLGGTAFHASDDYTVTDTAPDEGLGDLDAYNP